MTAQLEDLQESQEKVTASQDSSSAELRNKLSEQIQKFKNLDNELQHKRAALEEAEQKTSQQEDRVRNLELALGKKNDEMKAMEDRYKKYLEKAKGVSSYSELENRGLTDSNACKGVELDSSVVKLKDNHVEISGKCASDSDVVHMSGFKQSSRLYEFEGKGPPNVKIICLVESNGTEENDLSNKKQQLIESSPKMRSDNDKPALVIVPRKTQHETHLSHLEPENPEYLFNTRKPRECDEIASAEPDLNHLIMREPSWEIERLVTSTPKHAQRDNQMKFKHQQNPENKYLVDRRIQGASSNPEFFPADRRSATSNEPVEIIETRVMDEWYKPQNEAPQFHKVSSLNDLPRSSFSANDDLVVERKRIQELETLLGDKNDEVNALSKQYKHFYELKIHAMQHECHIKMTEQEKAHKLQICSLEKDLKEKDAEYQRFVTDAKYYIAKLQKNSVSGLGIVCDLLFKR